MRISVSCSRAALVSFRASSSSRSVVHRPSFGSGWTSRSYARDVSPDRSILRTVFRDTRRSRAICLIVLPLTKCSRRIRPIVSTVSIPPPPASNQSEQRIRPNWRGSILDADNPLQGVKIARRITVPLADSLGHGILYRPDTYASLGGNLSDTQVTDSVMLHFARHNEKHGAFAFCVFGPHLGRHVRGTAQRPRPLARLLPVGGTTGPMPRPPKG